MITSKDLTEFTQSHPDCPKDWTPNKKDILEFRETAKDVNEGIQHDTVDTLTTILGDEDGAKAIATNVNNKTYTVIQCIHDGEGGQYRSWIHWDSIDGVHHHDFSFETIAFYYPVDEPVWMKG